MSRTLILVLATLVAGAAVSSGQAIPRPKAPEAPRRPVADQHRGVKVTGDLRNELTATGTFNITEHGSVKDQAQLEALLADSPYRRVSDGTRYPAVLLLTGANDPRVDPMSSRKMVARLQAASSSGLPILLRTSGSTGHGGGTPLSEKIVQYTDVYAFLFAQLGRTYVPVDKAPGR